MRAPRWAARCQSVPARRSGGSARAAAARRPRSAGAGRPPPLSSLSGPAPPPRRRALAPGAPDRRATDPEDHHRVEVAADFVGARLDLLQLRGPVRELGERETALATPCGQERTHPLELGPQALELRRRVPIGRGSRGKGAIQVQTDRQGVLPATAPW